MLPGIRFLLAAIVLSMSILIFGLGAAALLRAAHEEVASVPVRRVMPEPVFAQPAEPPLPTLALLRVEPAAPEKGPDAPSAAIQPPEPAPEAVPVPKVEEEKLAALKPDDAAPAGTAKPEIANPDAAAKPEITVKPETAAAPETPPPATSEPAPSADTKLAAPEAPPSPSPAAASAPVEQIVPPAAADPGVAATKIAALGSPAAKVEKTTEATKAGEKPDRAEIKRQQRAERAKERRREAARRAKLAARQAAAAAAAQQTVDIFSQVTQAAQPATTAPATRRRN